MMNNYETNKNSSSVSKGSLGASFLFGNIDEKGKLEEDYLDEDAKEHLDHVAGSISYTNQELEEIRVQKPREPAGKTKYELLDDEDYDEEEDSKSRDVDEPHTSFRNTGVDYGDEEEFIDDDLNEDERKKLAELAISKGKSQSTLKDAMDLDEDYDEDNHDQTIEGENKTQASGVKEYENNLPAKEDFNSSKPSILFDPTKEEPIEKVEESTAEQPPRFSTLFSAPKRKVPKEPMRQIYGFIPEQNDLSGKDILLAKDEMQIFLDPVQAINVDPLQKLVEDDDSSSERSQTDDLISEVNQNECIAASNSLAKRPPIQEFRISVNAHSLLHQTEWEQQIIWNTDEDIVAGDLQEKVIIGEDEEDEDSNIDWETGDGIEGDLEQKDEPKSEKFSNIKAGKEDNENDALAFHNYDRKYEKRDSLDNANRNTHEPESLIATVLVKNQDLESGLWVDDIVWDSDCKENLRKFPSARKLTKLILDLNDSHIIFEPITEKSLTPKPSVEMISYNISNDQYYWTGGLNVAGRRQIRKSVLRGLQHAPPTRKALTLLDDFTSKQFLRFHRPKINVPAIDFEPLRPFRRRRPKQGQIQIAGQVPKKKSELSCAASRDSLRVSIFEYALERNPTLVPTCGMAMRMTPYVRRKSAQAASAATAAAAGTSDADTVFLAPDDKPPLNSGDIPYSSEKKVYVLESTIYNAACHSHIPQENDFLVVCKGGKYNVREIDFITAVGVTEPQIEVMQPASDRCRKYAKERVVLWAMRQLVDKKKKEGVASLTWEEINKVFGRSKSFPTQLITRAMKEVSVFRDPVYIMSEPDKGFAALEAEVLRTITPEETCSFESMEAGLERLRSIGIDYFFHPTSQGNILAAAENCGLAAGPPVGKYIREQLIKTPWFKSSSLVSGQKNHVKELMSSLTLARTANELMAGPAAAEIKLAQMSSPEILTMLTSYYKIPNRRIPNDLEERRTFLKEVALKKPRGGQLEPVDLSKVVRTSSDKYISSCVALGIRAVPLEIQLSALVHGKAGAVPREEDRILADATATLAATLGRSKAAFGGKIGMFESNASNKNKRSRKADKKTDGTTGIHDETEELNKLMDYTTKKSPEMKPMEKVMKEKRVFQANDGDDIFKKKPKRLKITKTVTGSDGKKQKVQEIVTDPIEIDKILAKKKLKVKSDILPLKDDEKDQKGDGSLKISIGLNGLKAIRGKKSSFGAERGLTVSKENRGSSRGERKELGKIRIDTKLMQKQKEEAALKRRRSQYGEDVDRRPVKKKSGSSRRRRNGEVALNTLLENVERAVREAKGFIVNSTEDGSFEIMRVKPGDPGPPTAVNLARPVGTGLDFTVPVENEHYKQMIKNPITLNDIKLKCKRLEYKSSEDFMKDMQLLADNARMFNVARDTYWVVQHADLLVEAAIEKIKSLSNEISEAEQQIAKSNSKDKERPPNPKLSFSSIPMDTPLPDDNDALPDVFDENIDAEVNALENSGGSD